MRLTLPTTTAPGTTPTTGPATSLSRATTSRVASGERRQSSSHLKTERRSQPGWRETEDSMVTEGVIPARGGVLKESTRVERDGGFHGHGGGHSSSRRRSGRRQQESGGRRQRPQEEFQGERRAPAPVAQEERRGRQSGGVGLALGILNNPADADGNYNFNFADNGMEREEAGHPGAVEGGYSYTSPEGELVSVEYVADEFGFHPVGSHIPVAPPMPPHVRRLLDHLAKVYGLAKL